MANAGQVLLMLCPDTEWTIIGEDFDSIVWNDGVVPITKKQFQDGFAQFDALQAEKDAQKAAATASAVAKLEAIGLTADEIAAIRG